MVKVLLLGADGLLGSRIQEVFRNTSEYALISVSRSKSGESYFDYNLNSLKSLVNKTKPDVIINCIVATDNNKSPLYFFKINSILPLHLSFLGFANKIKILHFSTDAVFPKSNRKYTEKSIPFSTTKYGITKAMGDLSSFWNVVIRTSFVGFSKNTSNERNLVSRIRNSKINSAITVENNNLWNGVTVDLLADLTRLIVEDLTTHKGIFHIFSSTPIQKCDLIELLKHKLNREDLHIRVVDSKLNKGVILETVKSQDTLTWWKNLGYSQIPSIDKLLMTMKV